MSNLENKNIIVTGASGGIGNSIIKKLNELKLIDNQVKYREELLQNFDNQIRSAELKIEQKNQQINELFSSTN